MATNKTQETNNALGLSGDSSQGEVIEFTQFNDRKNFREIPDGFSFLEHLAITKRPLVLSCPLETIETMVVSELLWCGGRTRTYGLRVMSCDLHNLIRK